MKAEIFAILFGLISATNTQPILGINTGTSEYLFHPSSKPGVEYHDIIIDTHSGSKTLYPNLGCNTPSSRLMIDIPGPHHIILTCKENN